MTDRSKGTDANRDPISGAAGAHPVGVGVGSAAGAAVGAAVGALGGPAMAAAGAAVGGAAVGGVVGGLSGKALAERIDPTVEDAYWSKSFAATGYVPRGSDYKVYEPAYRYGWESYARYPGRKFDDVELELSRDWDKARGKSSLSWDRAKAATRDAWHRVERAIPGDADKDGR